MKQKGFTLIELLAVIVVLAVIALIAIPVITNVIDKAKVGALKDSAYGILDAGELYIANNLKEGIPNNLTFSCTKNKCTSETKEINYKGNINAGTLILTTDSKTLVCVDNGKNYALKLASDKDVTTGTGTCGSYEETNGSFNIISDIDTLRKELSDLKSLVAQMDVTAEDVKEGKKVLIDGKIVSGLAKKSNVKLTINYTIGIQTGYYGYAGQTSGSFNITIIDGVVTADPTTILGIITTAAEGGGSPTPKLVINSIDVEEL